MDTNSILNRLSLGEVLLLVKEIEDSDLILIEGDKRSLLALSDLLAAVASSCDDHLQLSPTMAGRALFHKDSTKGVYIRCVATKTRSKRKPSKGTQQ